MNYIILTKKRAFPMPTLELLDEATGDAVAAFIPLELGDFFSDDEALIAS